MRSCRIAALCVLSLATTTAMAARAGADDVAAGLRARADRIEAGMAEAVTRIATYRKEHARAEAKFERTPEDVALEAECERLEQVIRALRRTTDRAVREVVRLRMEAARIEARGSKAPLPKGKGLWDPQAPDPGAFDLSPSFYPSADFEEHQGAEIAPLAAEVVRTQTLADLRVDRKLPFLDIDGKRLLVVDGEFDEIGASLLALGIPFDTTSPAHIEGVRPVDFGRYDVVLWNCGVNMPAAQAKRIAARLRAYVARGGYLFATDWAIRSVLVPAFPEVVRTHGHARPLPERILPVVPVKGAEDSPYLEGVLGGPVQARWWLEEAGFDVGFVGTFRGRRLLESPVPADGRGGHDTLAFVFRHGKGRVLHSAAHVYQQAGNLAGAVALQRLMLDFVLTALLDPSEREPDGL